MAVPTVVLLLLLIVGARAPQVSPLPRCGILRRCGSGAAMGGPLTDEQIAEFKAEVRPHMTCHPTPPQQAHPIPPNPY